MEEGAWVKELKAAITVCDRSGVALEMNDRAAETHEKDGGRELLGKLPSYKYEKLFPAGAVDKINGPAEKPQDGDDP